MSTSPQSVSKPVSPVHFADDPFSEVYAPDMLSRRHTVAWLAGSMLAGGFASLVVWLVLRTTNLPAFGSSNVLQALSTVGSVVIVLVVSLLCYLWVEDEHISPAERAARGPWWRRLRQRLSLSEEEVAAEWFSPKDDEPLDAQRFTVTRPRWRQLLTQVACYLAPAGLVVTSTAIPLAATRLYLDGITIDQGFRTQFLSRMAVSARLTDMNYIDMPSFYPSLWFWLGGRLANLLGITGWEVFQPWAIVSLAAAASTLVPVWQRITGSLPVAAAIGLVSTAAVIVTAGEEPYAAIVALGAPAATIVMRRAVEGRPFAMLGIIIYLGVSASMYTLYTAVVAASVMVIAVLFAIVAGKSWRPIGRMIVIGVCSAAVASIVWAPYLLARYVQQDQSSGATATHYLPLSGSMVPLPMLSWSLIGALCMLGLIYLVVRALDPDVRSMGVALVVVYLWVLASMISTLSGRTLLGFRLDVVIVLILVSAGVLAIAELRLHGLENLYPQQISRTAGRRITQGLALVLAVSCLAYVGSIPQKNRHAIDLAYTDTDGFGQRADRFPPDAGAWYPEINEFLLGGKPAPSTDRQAASSGSSSTGSSSTGEVVPNSTVVLTDEANFMSYYPYRGFQAFTSHYANPLGEFDRRNQLIEKIAKGSWGTLQDPGAFIAAWQASGWHAPQAFILRGDIDDHEVGWKFDLAEDIFPNNPNVRFRGVFFNPQVFTAPNSPWEVAQIGPFVVARLK